MRYHLNLAKTLQYLTIISLTLSFISISVITVYTLTYKKDANLNENINTSTPEKKNNFIVLISIDGLGSNLIDTNPTYIKSLLKDSETSYYFDMQTIQQSATIASHISMMTGLTQERHGFYGFSTDEFTPPLYHKTIFDYAIENNYSSYAFLTKSKLLYLFRDKNETNVTLVEKNSSDIITDLDNFLVKENKDVLLFIHLGDIDYSGHTFGWNSAEQIESLKIVDKNLEIIMDNLSQEFIDYSRHYILTSDHGGEGLQHENGCDACRRIPLIIRSENTESKYTLNNSTYNIYDVTCIILDLMRDERNYGLDCVR